MNLPLNSMENYLIAQYRADSLPHAVLFETDKITAQRLVDEFTNELQLTAANALQITSDETVKVAQIREAIHFASLSNIGNKPKVISITDATKLTLEAANAFLKTLEEPPRQTYFILAATQLDAILPTIRSRCRIVTIKGLAQASNKTSLPFPQPTLAAYFNQSKQLAAGDIPLVSLLQDWLLQVTTQPPTAKAQRYQALLLRYLQLAQNNPNKRLFLDNLFLDAYNSGEDSKDIS